jgi:squalene-hopene/tetraprenyl-beta-curcumene cyclase
MTSIDEAALDRTLKALKERLVRARNSSGFWEGKLSGSALSTAVAAFALALANKSKHASLIEKAVAWLLDNQNSDGGWGDTVKSVSNISTTMLCWSALAATQKARGKEARNSNIEIRNPLWDPWRDKSELPKTECSKRSEEAVHRAEAWLVGFAGSLSPGDLALAVDRKYGRDRSFSVPILTMCALAGRLGDSEQAWKKVKPLPFELAMLPHRLYSWLRLPVVSYALPALIAIGQAHYHHRTPANPVTRLVRRLSLKRTLKVLESIQPENGGFLEATPLTAFVVMSLTASGQKDSEVVRKGVDFLVDSARDDGSWPIDTNLATWVTTLSVNALAAGDDLEQTLSSDERDKIRRMLLDSALGAEHPYTHAAPGGWAWTALPGAVPDADDTAGALIALKNLGAADENVTKAAAAGIEWLLGLQNSDGGIPTFCRGWTNLPFDRSTPDLTAHALAAFAAWSDSAPLPLQRRIDGAIKKGLGYLNHAQRPNGAWVPLWFGNEYAPNQENPVYGTARVLLGLLRLPRHLASAHAEMLTRAAEWLLSVQNPDGGWGGDKAVASSIEETALSVDALAEYICHFGSAASPAARSAVSQGVARLIKQAQTDPAMTASPIGLYFAKLWYFEDLYPLVFTVSALHKARNLC